MAKFTTEMSEGEKKKRRRLVYIAAALCLFCFVMMCIVKNQKFIFLLEFLLIGAGLGIAIFVSVREIGAVKSAVIDSTYIQWLVTEKNKMNVLIAWDDVEWIKKENDGYISFFMSSSLSESLRMGDFSEEKQKELTELVIQFAHQRNIRLVNFSEPSLAMT